MTCGTYTSGLRRASPNVENPCTGSATRPPGHAAPSLTTSTTASRRQRPSPAFTRVQRPTRRRLEANDAITRGPKTPEWRHGAPAPWAPQKLAALDENRRSVSWRAQRCVPMPRREEAGPRRKGWKPTNMSEIRRDAKSRFLLKACLAATPSDKCAYWSQTLLFSLRPNPDVSDVNLDTLQTDRLHRRCCVAQSAF